MCLTSLSLPGFEGFPFLIHFSLDFPPFQAFVVKPRISVFIKHLSKVRAKISEHKAATVIGLPRIEPELSINKDTIEYLPKGAVVTNVARGDIIEDEAMIDALNRRKVYAAGLDVYNNEPNLNPGYLKHKSVFILPHLGSATKETRTAMANLAIDNIEEFFKTGSCKNKVN